MHVVLLNFTTSCLLATSFIAMYACSPITTIIHLQFLANIYSTVLFYTLLMPVFVAKIVKCSIKEQQEIPQLAKALNQGITCIYCLDRRMCYQGITLDPSISEGLGRILLVDLPI